MTRKTTGPNNDDQNNDQIMGSDATQELSLDPIEARLAAYGNVLRAEMADDDRRTVAAPMIGEDTDSPIDMRSSTASRRARMRTGVLVAAVLALIAGFAFVANQNEQGTSLQVANEPATNDSAPAIDGQDDDDTADDDGESTADDVDDADDATSEATDVLDEAPSGSDPDEVVVASDDPDADGADGNNSEGTIAPGEPEPEDTDPEQDEAEIVCAQGELVGDRCRIIGAPPSLADATCPTGASFDGQGCYTVEPADPGSCDPLEAHDDTSCRELVAQLQGLPTCPSGYTWRAADAKCTQLTAVKPSCISGSVEDDECVIVGDPPVRAPASCPPDDDVMVEGDNCYRYYDPSCGDLAETSDGLNCRQPGTITQITGCAIPGLAVIDGQCAEPNTAFAYCPPGTIYEASNCLASQPPQGDPPACPTGWGLTFPPEGGTVCQQYQPLLADCTGATELNPCYTFFGPPETLLQCVETGVTVQDASACWTPIAPSCPDLPDCKELVEKLPGELNCASGFALRSAQCVRYEPTSVQCPEGELDLYGTSCVLIANTIIGAPSCPIDDDIVKDGNECYRLTPRPQCTDLTPINNGCRKPVDAISGGRVCQDGFDLVNNQCIRWENP